MTRAVDRLRDEMAARHDDAALCALGELLTAALPGNPRLAAAVLDEKKTLAGAYQALEEFARKLPRKGNSVCVTDAAALKVALKYYGADAGVSPKAPLPEGGAPQGRGEFPAPFAPSLDDLLEGL